MLRRLLPFALAASLSTLFIFVVFQNASWRLLPQAIGLGGQDGPSDAQIKSGQGILPDLRQGQDEEVGEQVEAGGGKWSGDGIFREPKIDVPNFYPVGETKPAGSNYTKTLVMPKMSGEDTEWIDAELKDLLASGALSTAIYHMDDFSAKLHPIMNRGNEAMAYLSYIIDFYGEDLPDVSIFMHSHRTAHHNNGLMDLDAALMIRHLSPERVTRDGYMNLRCHWEPGCPDWLHPGVTEKVWAKPEQHVVAHAWIELFPFDPVPEVLSQPCCGQFAVSRERILAIPKSKFVWLRDWILRTDLGDYLSGRVFEYAWQYIFTSSPIHCPSMSACYCDGYGLCFGDAENFDYQFEMRYNRNELGEELRQWKEKAKLIEEVRAKNGRMSGEEVLHVPEGGKDAFLRDRIEEIEAEMERTRAVAFARGSDPQQRAKEAGREWKEGDGY